MKKIIFLATLLACLSSYAQESDTTYYDKEENPCDADTAYFFSVSDFQGEQEQVTEYFTSNHQIRQQGLKIESEYGKVQDGLWKTFYENGNPMMEINYKLGSIVDTTFEWFENGQKKAIWTHQQGKYLLSSWSEAGTQMVKAGAGTFEEYFPNGQLHLSGSIKSGKQDGIWKAFHDNGHLKHHFEIREGILTGMEEVWNHAGQKIFEQKYLTTETKWRFWDDQGALTYNQTSKLPPAYQIDWKIIGSIEPQPINMNQVRQAIGYPDIARDAGIQGLVVVRVLANKKGEIEKEVWIKEVHPILKRAVQTHLHELTFLPAIVDGEYTRFWVNIPFRFQLLDRKSKKKKKRN